MTSAQYDSIISDYNSVYDDLQALPCGQLEEANFHAAVAPHVQGKRVLDLACGSGRYTRRLLDWGANSVLGVDISPGMVEEARARYGDSQTLEFAVGDACADLDLAVHGGPFDVVVAAWLLNYASTAREMEAMWRTICRNLRCSGIFVGLTIPPHVGSQEELDRALKEDWAPYGTAGHVTGIVDDGFDVHIALGMPGSSTKVEFNNFHLKNDVFESSCKASGMGALEWLPLVVPAELKGDRPTGFWNRLVLNPHFQICTAARP